MWTIEKEYTNAGDCWVWVKFDGVNVLGTTWLGDSDESLIEMAKTKVAKNA